MDVLTTLYELKDKSARLGEDDRAFVLRAISVHEDAARQLNQQEIQRVEELGRKTGGVRAACAHLNTAPVFESGEETGEKECVVCGHRSWVR
jgi:hypothetical protein